MTPYNLNEKLKADIKRLKAQKPPLASVTTGDGSWFMLRPVGGGDSSPAFQFYNAAGVLVSVNTYVPQGLWHIQIRGFQAGIPREFFVDNKLVFSDPENQIAMPHLLENVNLTGVKQLGFTRSDAPVIKKLDRIGFAYSMYSIPQPTVYPVEETIRAEFRMVDPADQGGLVISYVSGPTATVAKTGPVEYTFTLTAGQAIAYTDTTDMVYRLTHPKYPGVEKLYSIRPSEQFTPNE